MRAIRATLWAEMSGERDVDVGRRWIPAANQRQALAAVASTFVVLMFVGRLGPLALASALALRELPAGASVQRIVAAR